MQLRISTLPRAFSSDKRKFSCKSYTDVTMWSISSVTNVRLLFSIQSNRWWRPTCWSYWWESENELSTSKTSWRDNAGCGQSCSVPPAGSWQEVFLSVSCHIHCLTPWKILLSLFDSALFPHTDEQIRSVVTKKDSDYNPSFAALLQLTCAMCITAQHWFDLVCITWEGVPVFNIVNYRTVSCSILFLAGQFFF